MKKAVRTIFLVTAISIYANAEAQLPSPAKEIYSSAPYQSVSLPGVQNRDWATETVVVRNDIPVNITARNVTRSTQQHNQAVVSIYVNGYRASRTLSNSAESTTLAFLQANGTYRIVAVCEAIRATADQCSITFNTQPVRIIQ